MSRLSSAIVMGPHSPLNQTAEKVCLTLFGAIIILAMSMNVALARPAPDSFADLAEKLLPTVVNVSTEQEIKDDGRRNMPSLPPGSPFQDFFDEFFDQQQGGEDEGDEDESGPPLRRAQSLGSGFVIDPAGYIVTNNHVIGEADRITVTFSNGDEFEAQIVGRDPRLDVALLKVDAGHPLPAAQWGDSEGLRVGEWVMAIGNPFGLGGTVTVGIVSAKDRWINAGEYDFFIQTDASINRGNSGGPMFNMEGKIVGMNTMIFSPSGGNIGIGFAIPSHQALRVVDQLREYGRTRRGWIGVTIGMVTKDIAESLGLEKAEGAIVGSVVEDGPADKAGIKSGDIILSFNGEPIEEMPELPRVVSTTDVGKTVPMKVLRDGKVLTVTLTTGELELAQPELSAEAQPGAVPERVSTDRVLGMRLAPLDGAVRGRFEVPTDLDGVVIAGVSRRSEAAFRGLRRGDVIVEANQKAVHSPAEVQDQIKAVKAAKRNAVLLRIYRDGAFVHVALPVDEGDG